MSAFHKRLKDLRNQAGLTQGDLAKKAKVTYIQIGRYENKGAVPSAEVLSRIADALNTTTDFLMNGSTDDKANVTLKDKELLSLFKLVEKLNAEDKKAIKLVIDSIVTKRQIQQLAS